MCATSAGAAQTRARPAPSATASSCPASAAGSAQRRPAARTASPRSTLSPGRLVGGGAREREQVVDQRAQPVELGLGLRRLLGRGPALGPDRLQPELDPGQRRAELVRGVGDEVALRGEVGRELAGHAVERAAELVDLLRALRLDARVEVAAPEPAGGRAQLLHRPGDRAGQDPGEDEPGGDDREADQRRARASSSARSARPRPSAPRPGSAPITSPRSVTGTVTSSRSSPSVSLWRSRTSTPPPSAACELGPLGGGERLAGGRGAVGVGEHAPARVDDDRARAVAAVASPRADRRSRELRLVASEPDEVGDPPRQHRRVRDDVRLQLRGRPPVDVQRERHGERDHDGGQQVGRREDEAGPEGHGASKRKPTPRTVWMYRGAAGSSPSFFRSALTWTSSVFVEPNQAGIPDLVHELVALDELARRARGGRAGARTPSRSGRAARRPCVASCVSRSMRTSPASSTVPAASAAPRRRGAGRPGCARRARRR